MHSDTYRPQTTEHVWHFLAPRINHQNVIQIANDLERYSVSIQITDDNEHFYICGYSEGVEQCKQRLSQLAAMVVQEEKKLEYPGIKRLFLDQGGMEQLQMIKQEMDVEIDMVHRSTKLTRPPMPLPRSLSLPSVRSKMFIHDILKFTTKEGINVSWRYGNIEDEVVDVLAYFAYSNLNNPTTCGHALHIRGGLSFREACRPYTNIEAGEIVTTGSGDLPCKYIIHAVCCNFHHFKEQFAAHEFLQGLFRKILNQCHELRVCSLAISSMSVGQHGFPEDVVSEILRNEIEQLSCDYGVQLSLKDILVIVPQSKLERRQSVPLRTTSRRSLSTSSREEERNAQTIAPMINFGPVRVYLSGKNEPEYQADALINFSFNMKAQNEQISQPPGTVLVTNVRDSGTVRRYFYCVPVSLNVFGLERAMKACLDAAKSFSLGNIVISSKEITSFGISASEYANSILNACQHFSDENFVMNIVVVIFELDTRRIFKKMLENKAEEIKDVKSHESDNESCLEVSAINDGHRLNKILTIGEKEELTFQLVGYSDNVKTSMEKIEGYLNRFKTRKSIKNAKVVNGIWKHKSEIKERAKGYEVFITLADEEVSIEGMAEQVFDCKDVLIEFLNKCDEEERELKRLREISENVQWSYSDVNGIILFDEILTGTIESEIADRRKKIAIRSEEATYEVDVDKMIIRENNTGRSASLTRERFESTAAVPEFWDPQPKDEEVHLVTLSRSSNEYQKIIELFGAANDIAVVQKIERIQNPRLYKMYFTKKQLMGLEANEKQLFHGTKSENLASINTNNFNRSLSGVNGTRFGRGVYFARDASYSIRFSEKDSVKGSTSFMYVAKVLVGKCVEGKKGMRVLPKRRDSRNPELSYDSAVDNTDDPSIFVTFDDYQCYPEYLITFQSQ